MLGARGKRDGRPSSAVFADDGRKLVLHVGCGPPVPGSLHERFRGPEWREVRLEIDPQMAPGVAADVVAMPEVPSQAVDAVWSAHNIEHVFAHQVAQLLAEFFRVLRPGGEVLITTPDLQVAAERIARGRLEDPLYESPSGPVTPLDMVYGHGMYVVRGQEAMAHKTGFTARTLEGKLRDAGFERVEVRRNGGDRALWATARRVA